ncbi:MAG: hypothetical protein QF570_17125 [Myxococcota bacterium]|jgi:hypothetical protein|nr:hypothetical protein [Myxococcota bacterium]
MAKFRETFSTIAIAVGLVLAVGIFLLAVGEWMARRVATPASTTSLESPQERYPELPRLRGLHDLTQPNQRGVFAGNLFETNRSGLRGPFRRKAKPNGVTRVVLAGDSFAMASGVLYENAYAARLEALYREGGHRVQVINVGLAGLNADAIVTRFIDAGLPYEPDVGIYGFTLDDILGDDYIHSADARFTNANPMAGSRSHLVRLLGPRIWSLYELLASPVGSYSHELDENLLDNLRVTDALAADFVRLREAIESRGGCGVVFIHPHLWALHGLHPHVRHYQAVQEIAEASGLTAIPSHPYFTSGLVGRAPDYWIDRSDPHPNAAGHAILARALFDGLQQLPARCGLEASS